MGIYTMTNLYNDVRTFDAEFPVGLVQSRGETNLLV